MRKAIGSDHAGFEYKEGLKNLLEKNGYSVTDFGPQNSESSDYADFAHPVAMDVEKKNASKKRGRTFKRGKSLSLYY